MKNIKNYFKNSKLIFFYLLMFIVFIGVFLRIKYLGNDSYWLDEGFTLMQGRGVINHGYPLLDSGWIEWKDLLMPYLIAPFIKLFGLQNSFILRLPAVIFGVATIMVGYYLARQLFSRLTALMFATFLSLGYWYIAWSQQVRGYSALVFFVLLFFYFLVKHSKQAGNKYLWLAFFTIILATLSKTFGVLLLAPFLFYLFKNKKYKILLLIALPTIPVMFLARNKISNIFNLQGELHFAFYIKQYLLHYFSVVSILGWFGLIASFLNDKKNRIIHGSILIFMLGALIIFSTMVIITEGRYLLMITPFLFLYTAYFIEYLTKNLEYKTTATILIFLIVLFSSFIFDHNIVLFPQKHYKLETGTPQPNYKQAYGAIKRNGFKKEDIIVSGNTIMDLIYLDNVDYTIRWSLTGRKGDDMFKNGQDMYTGAQKLYSRDGRGGIEKIKKLQHKFNVYVVLDSLALHRMNPQLREDIIHSNGQVIFKEKGRNGIVVYFFKHTPKNASF